MLNFIQHILGLNDPGSAWYLAWSGFVGDVPVFVAVFLWYRHNKCHNCFRLGHHVPNIHYPVCRKHKPLAPDEPLRGYPRTSKPVNDILADIAHKHENIKVNDDGTISPADPDKPSSYTT